MHKNLHIFENATATAQAVAELMKEKAQSTASGSFVNIALSGGSTPQSLFELLANEYETTIDWTKVRLFWVDERCVAPTDAESNYGMTYDSFLQRTFVPGENIFRMRGEEIPEFEAERYRNLLLKELPARDGYPVFDLVLLGMGTDGHTASIFPNDLTLIDSEFSVAVNTNPYTNQKRLTLTCNTINNAKHIVFMITGQSKAELVKEIIENNPKSKKYPAAHISGNVDYYLDKSAATEL